MQLDEKRFEALEKKVDQLSSKVDKIFNWSIGDEFHPNGINQRIERLERKEKNRDKKWWIAIGGFAVLIFLIKWGDKILKLL